MGAGCDGLADLGGEAGVDGGVASEGSLAEGPTEGGARVDATCRGPDGAGDGVDALAGDVASDTTTDADGAGDAPAEAAADTGADATGACADGIKDGSETAVDCGGSCPPCGPSKHCLSNSDCSPTASGCDTVNGGCYCQSGALVCVYNHCYDRVKDVGETAVDCGGNLCSACADGLGCLGNSDCLYMACDAISLVCVANQCADHHQDGTESDVDCGGINCNPCPTGGHCNDSFDCASGHTCSASHACT
jgi:hypothetical protein